MLLSDAWVDFVAGWCSGASAVLACQPVDTILTRWQAGLVVVQPTAAAASSSTTSSASVAANQTRALYQMTGTWRALWRGASPMIGAVPVQNALLMGGYGVGQQYSARYAPEYRRTAVFVGGCTGGVLQSFLMSPVELVKVLQQCAGQSLSQAVRAATWQRGLGATLLRDGIPHGVWFVAYEECKDVLTKMYGKEDAVVVPLTAGAGAATIAWAVGYPADVIKTRIQASANPMGIIDTGRLLIQEANGSWRGLYRGFGLKLVRSVPASMIGFGVYEFVKRNVLDVI